MSKFKNILNDPYFTFFIIIMKYLSLYTNKIYNTLLD